MAIFPLPPGLTARLNVPPNYETATEDTAPPAYIAPLNSISTPSPESIPLPPSPAPASSSSSPSISTPTPQIPPPEYSPSVYSQQRTSHYLPNPNPDPADFGFPSSPRRPSACKTEQQQQQQQQHQSHFKESRTDLSMRLDLEAAAASHWGIEQGGEMEMEMGNKNKKSVFRLYPPVKEGEVERLYWKRGLLAVGIGLGVVVVVAVVVGVGVYK